MNKLFPTIAAIIFAFLAVPATAHHAAEGIISDDIYDMIDENLAGSPHLDMDLTTVGSGSATMSILTVTVEETDVDAVLAIIGEALVGAGTAVNSSLDVDISPTGTDDLVTIIIMESIGQGESQIP